MPIQSTSTETKTQLKTSTMINLLIGMGAVLFVAAGLLSEAFIDPDSPNSSASIVQESISPQVEITSPVDQEILWGFNTIKADITNDSGITKVDFYINDQLIFSDTDSSDGWQLRWDTSIYSNGKYKLQISATDKNKNVGLSEITTVTLNN